MLRVPSSTVSSRLRYSRLFPDLDRPAVFARPADTHALGIIAAVAERAGAAGADPFGPALVPLLLLVQTLFQRLHQLVEPAHGLDRGPVLVAQVFLGQLLQPVIGNGGGQVLARAHGLDPGKDLAEHLVEPVVVFLVLDQHRPRQMVEVIDLPPCHVLVHGLHQVEPFLHRDRNARVSQSGEKGQQHQSATVSRLDRRLLRSPSMASSGSSKPSPPKPETPSQTAIRMFS